jgi:hypothetical protein
MLYHIVGVQLLNGAVVNTVGSNRKSEIKHGGCQTGSTVSSHNVGNNSIVRTDLKNGGG